MISDLTFRNPQSAFRIPHFIFSRLALSVAPNQHLE
jgi:hypothetical protein